MTALIKKTGEQFISIFAESEDDPDEELEKLYSLSVRLHTDIKAEKAAGEQRQKSLSAQHASSVQGMADQLSAVRSAQDRVKDKLAFLREEASLLEDQIRRAEQLRTELAHTLQSPEAGGDLPEDEPLEFYKSEVMTSRQVQANLKSVIYADELLMEDAAREKERVLELLQSKENDVNREMALKDERNRKWTEEVRDLQSQIETLKAGRCETDERDLVEVLQMQKRTLETLKNEKSALTIQLESRKAPVLPQRQAIVSKLTDLEFVDIHPAVRKVASWLDDIMQDLRIAMDDFAVVKLIFVLYLLTLHLWVLLSTLGVSTGC